MFVGYVSIGDYREKNDSIFYGYGTIVINPLFLFFILLSKAQSFSRRLQLVASTTDHRVLCYVATVFYNITSVLPLPFILPLIFFFSTLPPVHRDHLFISFSGGIE